MQATKKRPYHGRLFKSRRAYSIAEIAEMLNVHIRTVQAWKKAGLKILDDETKPYLIMGQDIQEYLKGKKKERKKPLKIGEFFCPRCRRPVNSHASMIKAEVTTRRLGRNYRQVLLRGICSICDQALTLFSSDRKARGWMNMGLIPAEAQDILIGIERSSANTDILKGRNNG